MRKTGNHSLLSCLSSPSGLASSWAMAGGNDKPAPLIIQEQGSFAVGGTVITNSARSIRSNWLPRDRRSTAITPMCFIRFR